MFKTGCPWINNDYPVNLFINSEAKTIGGKYMRRSFITLVLTLLIYSGNQLCWAAPNIQSVSGTVGNNQTVQITGSGFGAKTKPAAVLWDRVDNISSYSGLSNGATIPVGGSNPWPSPYGNSSGNNYVKYNTSDSQRGVSTAQYKATNATTGYLDGLSWSGTNYVYISWWWKVDRAIPLSNNSSKFLRVSTTTNEGRQTFSWTQLESYVYSDPNYCCEKWHSFDGNPNNWNFIEAWFNSVNRTYTLRVNGSTVMTASWASCSSFLFNELWKIGFDGGGVSPPAVTWWMDDIYVDNTFSRVMLGNSSTYSGCTHLEMQPVTAWNTNGTAVTITFNSGSFTQGQTAYLYLVDSTGSVSNGRAVTIGQSAGSMQSTEGTQSDEADGETTSVPAPENLEVISD